MKQQFSVTLEVSAYTRSQSGVSVGDLPEEFYDAVVCGRAHTVEKPPSRFDDEVSKRYLPWVPIQLKKSAPPGAIGIIYPYTYGITRNGNVSKYEHQELATYFWRGWFVVPSDSAPVDSVQDNPGSEYGFGLAALNDDVHAFVHGRIR